MTLDLDSGQSDTPARKISTAMAIFRWMVTHLAPIFLVTSPVTSYADQILSINRNRSSGGFSLDIPLIMLVASILKLFFWLGDRFDTALLIQAAVMVVVQMLLLHIALVNRPPFGAQHSLHKPFAGATGDSYGTRPFNFWQWRHRRSYWEFLAYFTLVLAALQLILGGNSGYVALQGYVALSIEATLPIPQILENQRMRSCKGFRLSVLLNWLIGDSFKMTYFFLSDNNVPWAFKLCGLFQAACDCYLGVQYCMYGEGEGTLAGLEEKDTRLA
ncbi:hypothetical protein BST61_g5756 [Cercospora zeina]